MTDLPGLPGGACAGRLTLPDSELANQAQNNTLDNFRLVFDKKFLQTVVTRVDANEEIFRRILDDQDFRATLGEFYLRKVYERLQASSPES